MKNNTTKLIKTHDDFDWEIYVTECCRCGPIVNENNFCPFCGKKIEK